MPEPNASRCSNTVNVGPYLLGGLDAADAAALRAHLGTCRACQHEVDQLAPVARALGDSAVRPEEVGAGPGDMGDEDRSEDVASRSILAAIMAEAEADVRRRRWRRFAAGFAAGAAAASLLAAALLWRPGGNEAVSDPIRVTLTGTGGTEAWVQLVSQPGGTYAQFHSRGLPGGHVYRMWVELAGGKRLPLGSFTPVEGAWVRCEGSAGTGTDQVVAVGASDEDGQTVVRGAVPGKEAAAWANVENATTTTANPATATTIGSAGSAGS